MAEAVGVSKATVHDVWKAFGIQPHRRRNFTLSTAPVFVENVGVCVDPPDNPVALCVDETQALERSRPALPLGLA